MMASQDNGSHRDRRGLGRGLSALMADVSATHQVSDDVAGSRHGDRRIPIDQIAPNPDQPRRRFADDDLVDLANSIREKGIIQPLIVRPTPHGPAPYQIVAGERRWRAAQKAQLHDVPVLVRDFDETEVLEVAIIENIQRADLNPVEEAAGYRQLMERFGHTQERLAEGLGKSRSHIANALRLLHLPEDVRTYLADGTLSAGHARALITTGNPSEIARRVVDQGLSVRETEKLAKAGGAKSHPNAAPSQPTKDADTRALEADLGAALGIKVSVDHATRGQGGALTLRYTSLDQLDDLCRRLTLTETAGTI